MGLEWVKKIFIRGIFIFLPLSLSLYLLLWFISLIENVFRDILLTFIEEGHYFKGLGIVTACVLIFGLGVIFSFPYSNNLRKAIEWPFKKLPVLKSVYTWLSEIILYFSGKGFKDGGEVVIIRPPGREWELVGLLTQKDRMKLPSGRKILDKVAVYIPMSYQVGGFTLFVPPDWVEVIDIGFERAMKGTFTGWMFEREARKRSNIQRVQ